MKNAMLDIDQSDITFIIENKAIHAHKVILCQNEYFQAMFSGAGGLKEAHLKEVPIHGVSYDVFKALLYYIYTWEMGDISPDIVVELFESANQFQIESLRHCCEAYLCNLLSKENVCQLFHLADIFKSLFLKEECFDFIVMNHWALCKMKDYLEMNAELRQEIEDYMIIIKQKKFANSVRSAKTKTTPLSLSTN